MNKHRIILNILFIFSGLFVFRADSYASDIGYLGVYVQELSKPVRIALDLDYGLLVSEVAENSPAEKGGIKEGDVILNINNEKMRDYSDLRDIVRDNPDKEINIEIYSAGKKKNIAIKLTQQKDNFYKWKWEGESFSRKDGDRFPFGFFSNDDVEKMRENIEDIRQNLENLYKELGKEYKKKEDKNKAEKKKKESTQEEKSRFDRFLRESFPSEDI